MRIAARSLSRLLPLALVLAACTPLVTLTPPPPATAPPPGDVLYAKNCSVCHGLDGRTVAGVTAPQLDNQGLLTTVDDPFLHQSIALGRPGVNAYGRRANKMTPFSESIGGPLTDAQIDAIVGRLRRWQTQPSAELQPFTAHGTAADGRIVYGLCSACHQPDGWSTVAPSLAGSTFQTIASDAFIRYTVLHGRPGTTMPGLDMTDAQLGNLIVFIRTLDDEAPGTAVELDR
jgi:mono/diheme cytochrome c family protein